MELHVVPWNSMKLHGILWNFMEFNGIPWSYFTRAVGVSVGCTKVALFLSFLFSFFFLINEF